MLVMVISGGQTGADQGGLRAARQCGLATGGWAAHGWLIEDLGWRGHGYRPDVAAPWLADYGLCECPEPGYAARRKRNVAAADAAILFGNAQSRGSLGLIGNCKRLSKPLLHVEPGTTTPAHAVAWLREIGPKILMVAGNRESYLPGIGKRVESFLTLTFTKYTESVLT